MTCSRYRTRHLRHQVAHVMIFLFLASSASPARKRLLHLLPARIENVLFPSGNPYWWTFSTMKVSNGEAEDNRVLKMNRGAGGGSHRTKNPWGSMGAGAYGYQY